MTKNLSHLLRAALFAFAVAVAFAVVNPAEAQYLARYIGASFTSSAPSGSNGFACRTNGCRVDLGAGASDYLQSDGSTIITPAGITVLGVFSAGGLYQASAGAPTLRGNLPNIASSRGWQVENIATLTAEGSRALSVLAGLTASQPLATVYAASGGLYLYGTATMPICGAAAGDRPEGTLYVKAGAAAVRTIVCVCAFTPTGAIYTWVNIHTGTAGTASTCP